MSLGPITTIGNVKVLTTSGRGHSADEIADLFTERAVRFSLENAPEPLKQQAIAFRENLRNIAREYIMMAMRSERTTVCNLLREAGALDLAKAVEREKR